MTAQAAHPKERPTKKTFKPRLWQWPIMIIGGSVALAALILVIGTHLPSPGAAALGSFPCTGIKSSDYQCWQTRLQTDVAKVSVKQAFDEVKSQYDTSAYAKGNCHQLTHVIGRAAAVKYPDVATAYKYGDNFCWSGYYHGVMETTATKLGYANVIAHANDICASLKNKQEYSFDHFNCVHGLGHGFMAIQNSNLPKALETCDLLEGSWQQESCYGGVFMENVMDEINPDHHTDWLKPDQPMYPCTFVGTKYKTQCYLMQTSHVLKANGYDFAATFAACSSIEPEFQATCFQSLGRDASGSSVSDVTRTKDTCNIGATYDARSNCVIGAVKDFVSYFHGESQAYQLCDSFTEEGMTALCRTTADGYYKAF